MNTKTLEICIPVYNEEDVIEDFVSDLFKWIDRYDLKSKFENLKIHFLNNGSDDKSLIILKKIKQQYKNIKLTSFEKNYGFYASTSYLIYASEEDFVILSNRNLTFKMF